MRPWDCSITIGTLSARSRVLTLNQALADRGLTTLPAANGERLILRDGVEVFRGRAHEVWAWLHETEAGR